MNAKFKSVFSTLIVCMFIFLFGYTALSKLFRHTLFLITLRESPLLHSAATIFSWLIPAVELITTMLLLIKRTKRIGMYVTFSLMVAFTGYILLLLSYNSNLPCSCGGIIQYLSWKQHFILNILLTFFAFFEIILFNLPTMSSTKMRRTNLA